MTVKRLYWENGLKLDSNLLSNSDQTVINNLSQANFLPANLDYGIVSLDLDSSSLKSGLILVKDLKIYLNNKEFITFDKTYPLSFQVDEGFMSDLVHVYLNIKDRVVEKQGIKYVDNQLSLSLENDYNSRYSIRLATFKSKNNELLMYDYDFPLLSCDHYLMYQVFLRLNRLVSELKAFNQMVFSESRPYASMLLTFLINSFERELEFAEVNKQNCQPYTIFKSVHDIYSLIKLNSNEVTNTDNILFDFKRPISRFKFLINELTMLCHHKKISNFVQFEPHGQKYICETFPEEFFASNKYYLVVRRKQNTPINIKFDKKSFLRITSISRNKSVVTLSLSGVILKEVDQLMINFAINLKNVDSVYEIQKGSEWDFILADKSAVFTAFDGSENFDFFILFA